ncbi:MAG TPA: hypothetical protein VFU63_04505 [Ktedonobacterales bacterium]|nr:hypothetical protein [Ktedonobacterales bacterium]
MDAKEQAYVTQRYVESIQRIPDDAFPCPGVQEAMIARAQAGETLYGYWSGSEYMVFHEQPRLDRGEDRGEDMQCHFTLEQWAQAHGFTTHAPRFAVGAIVRWTQGRCAFRVDGSSRQPTPPYTRWYGGPILSGENAGSYALSVPEEQLELELEQEGA